MRTTLNRFILAGFVAGVLLLATGEARAHSLTDETAAGIRQRFTDAAEKKRHAEPSVDAGRDYVAAYVGFVHHVEALHAVATRKAASHGHSEPASPPAEAGHHDH